jgi:hypothetical protein
MVVGIYSDVATVDQSKNEIKMYNGAKAEAKD